MAARGFLGAGSLYVSRYNPVTALFDPFVGPIECTKFEITPKVELKEMTSKGRETYGQVIESVPIPQPFEFACDFAEVNGDTLVNAFLGTKSAVNVGGGTLTALTVKARKGAWVELGCMNVTAAGFTVTNNAGTTTYALGTDYEVNYRLGMLQILPGSVIVEGVDLKVNGAYGAISGTQIAGGTNAQVRAKFRLDGKNFADGLPVVVNVHEAVIAADSAFDFLANDFNTVSLPGRLKTPVGKTEPFTVTLLDAAI